MIGVCEKAVPSAGHRQDAPAKTIGPHTGDCVTYPGTLNRREERA